MSNKNEIDRAKERTFDIEVISNSLIQGVDLFNGNPVFAMSLTKPQAVKLMRDLKRGIAELTYQDIVAGQYSGGPGPAGGTSGGSTSGSPDLELALSKSKNKSLVPDQLPGGFTSVVDKAIKSAVKTGAGILGLSWSERNKELKLKHIGNDDVIDKERASLGIDNDSSRSVASRLESSTDFTQQRDRTPFSGKDRRGTDNIALDRRATIDIIMCQLSPVCNTKEFNLQRNAVAKSVSFMLRKQQKLSHLSFAAADLVKLIEVDGLNSFTNERGFNLKDTAEWARFNALTETL